MHMPMHNLLLPNVAIVHNFFYIKYIQERVAILDLCKIVHNLLPNRKECNLK